MPKPIRHFALSTLALSLLYALPAVAQVGAPAAGGLDPQDFLKGAHRIDGRKLATTVTVVAELPSSGGSGDSATLTLPTANVVMDGWTRRPATGATGEDYDFVAGDDVTFTVLVKIGEPGAGGTAGEGLDILLFPCGTATIPPVPSPVVLVDDIIFTPIAPAGVQLVALSVTLTGLDGIFPAGSRVDWLVAADFDVTNNPDTDGDTVPDCCLETGPLRFVDVALPTVDELGATLISFFNPGPGAINVFRPHPPNPASKALGATAGEDGETRPWCFGIN